MPDERVKHTEFYERKALEARAKAETIKNWDARRTMLLAPPCGNPSLEPPKASARRERQRGGETRVGLAPENRHP